MSSILVDVKQHCNIDKLDCSFDREIIDDINFEFAKLFQFGVGPEDGFMIEDETSEWTDFTEDKFLCPLVTTFVEKSARVKFDPPANSTLMSALAEQIAEAEWRIKMHAEGYTTTKIQPKE